MQNLQLVGAVPPCQPLWSDTGWQGRAAPTDAHDVGRLQILRNAPYISRYPIASRPAGRKGLEQLENLRAIPGVFSGEVDRLNATIL